MRLFNCELFSVSVKTSKKYLHMSLIHITKKEGRKDVCEACNVTFKKTKKILDSRLLFNSGNIIR